MLRPRSSSITLISTPQSSSSKASELCTVPHLVTVTPIRDSEGNLQTAKASILERWAEHFDTLLNRPSIIEDQIIDDLPQRSLINLLDECPTIAEAKKAVDHLQSGKAPGPDGIPPEIFKSGGYALLVRLTNFFQLCWDNGVLPQDLKDANIIHLYKNKGEKTSCDNHRGISLLSIAGKILARIILDRLIEHI